MVGNRRLTRRELKQKDQVLTGMEAALHYVEHHRREALAGGIALLLLVAAGFAGAAYMRSRSRAANAGLGEAVEIFEASVGEAAESATPAPATRRYPTAEAKYQAAADKSAAIAREAASSGVGRSAALLEAGSLVRLGRTEDAIKGYRALVQSGPMDSIGAAASLALGDLLAAKGETDAAIDSYRKLAAADSVHVPKEVVLDHLARTLEKKGDLDGARDAYQRLADEAGDAPEGARAKTKLAELKATATPAPSPAGSP